MASNFTQLTYGILDRILAGDEVPESFVVQIISARKLGGTMSGSKPRYCFVISDGMRTHPLATLNLTQNALYESGQLCDMTVIRVNHHLPAYATCSDGSTRRQVILMLDVDSLHHGSDVRQIIGNPTAHVTATSEFQQILKQFDGINIE